jgi:hypothetical protein
MARGKESNEYVPHISFYTSDKKNFVMEYIPGDYSNFDYKVRDIWRNFLDIFNVQTYYWQYRHLITPNLRKIHDLQFLIHVWTEHEGLPENRLEREHYRSVWALYGLEFTRLILPKIEIEQENRGVHHPYARAYYKRWLKPADPRMKQYYHGVGKHDRLEFIEFLIENEVDNEKRAFWRAKYHTQAYRKQKSKGKSKK